MAPARDTSTKRDTEVDILWMLIVAYWPYVRFSMGLISFLALLFGPPGSFVLTFGLLVLLSWMVLNTDPKTGQAPSLAPLIDDIKKLIKPGR